MNNEIPKSLYERVIGRVVMNYTEKLRPEELFQMAESEAMKLLSEIKKILDDHTLDDPECFHRIEAIVNAFEAKGLSSDRHDW